MKKINYGGSSKILNGIVTKINAIIDSMVVDVKVNDVSVVDENHVANIDLTLADQNVKQSPTTDDADYRILLSKSANDTEETDISRKNTNFKYNPSTGNLQVSKVNGNTVPSGSGNDTLAKTSEIPTVVNTYDGTSTDAISGMGVKAALDTLPEPMVYKGSLGTGGTISDLPMDGSATIGDTYKVITEGDYGNNTYHAEVGDTFICYTKTSSANTWTLIPSGDEPSGTVTSVTIQATSPIAVDNSSAITESGTRTISHETSGVTASSYGDSSAQTPSFGGTFKTLSATVNATGHVTAMGEHTVTIPSAVATTSANGLMSSTDKSNLDNKRAVNLELTNEDLDDVKTVGFYVGKSGNTCANKPSGFNQFGLFVIRTATSGTGNYYKQTLIRPITSGETWTRSCVNGTWSAWTKEITTDENVKQSPIPSTNANYPLLLAYSANGTEETNTVWKDTDIAWNPSTNTFKISNGYMEAYRGTYSELLSTFIGFMFQGTLLAYFSPNPNQASGTTVEAVMPATSGTLALQSELLNKLSWEENKASGVKNYFNYPYYHPKHGEVYTQRGVNYTDNGDGGILANGTCDNTGNSYCQILKTTTNDNRDKFCRLPQGKYHFSGGISNDYYMNLSRGLISNPSADRTTIGTDYGDGFDFEVTEQQAKECYFCSFCFVEKNKTANNVVFYPMITRYEDSSQGYAEYAMTNKYLTQLKADMDDIAPTETSGNARQAYAVGDYMFWRGGFYRVTAAIASGGAITQNTNVVLTTLGAELKAIRNALNL